MKEIKHLIKTMLDDLKDTHCLYDYAKHSHKEEHREHFNFYIDKAMDRIDSIKKTDKMVQKCIKEYIQEHHSKDTNDELLWECLYGHYIEEVENLEEKIKDLKMKG